MIAKLKLLRETRWETPEKLAAVSSIVASAPFLLVWYFYLFIALPDWPPMGDMVFGQLAYSFSYETPTFLFFLTMSVAPLTYLLIGSLYFRGLARKRQGAIALFGTALLMGILLAVFCNPGLASVTLFSIYWGWRCVKQPLLGTSQM